MNLLDLFDDIVKDEYGTWTQICKTHAENSLFEKIGTVSDCSSKNTICGCVGCNSKAVYYLDIYKVNQKVNFFKRG